jgi:hypothetical protein
VGKDGANACRVTTTLTLKQSADLEQLAKAHGVKVAWLVRRGVEMLLEQADATTLPPIGKKG